MEVSFVFLAEPEDTQSIIVLYIFRNPIVSAKIQSNFVLCVYNGLHGPENNELDLAIKANTVLSLWIRILESLVTSDIDYED